MTVESAPPVEIAQGPRSALDYPNIRACEVPPGQLAATPVRTLALGLFMLHVIRRFERWLLDHADLVHGPLHSSIGQEAVAVGTALALVPADRLSSTHRAHHDVLAKLIAYAAPGDFDPVTAAEVPAAVQDVVLRTFAEILGLEQGMCRGRGGSMHLADVDGGITTSAIVGGGIPVSAGQALASKLRGDGSVALASFGDGATSIGAFHEAAVLARSWRLPMIFLLENNQYAVATTLSETAGFTDFAIRSSGYDMPALVVDGMDPIAVLAAMTAARAHAASDGPVFVEAKTYRYYHQNGPLPGSSFKYRTKDEEARWAALDPIRVFPRRLLAAGLLDQAQLDHVEALAGSVIDACAAAVTEDTPDGLRIPPSLYPANEDAHRGMLGPGVGDVPAELLDTTPVPGAPEITYGAAVSGVIARWLEREPEAFVLGEEVGHLGGGVMGLTKAALAVAPDRVLSTPICENGFTGAAFGAALSGMRPIVEFMYPDFTLEAADQLFNHIPKARYMFGGIHRVPLVVRTQISRGRGYGPQHGADPAALFALFPGWRVASPSTAAEYVGLFNAAMRSGDPVLVLDDHRLTRTTGALPQGGMDHVLPPGTARLVREGRDATVVAWGFGLLRVLALAEGLAADGISIEIVDPRWLDRASFDRPTVLASVARTGRLVIVEDAQHSMSMGSQILDYLLPDLFGHLRVAPVRVTGEDVYSPVSRPVETYVHLRDENIEQAIRSVVAAVSQGGVAR